MGKKRKDEILTISLFYPRKDPPSSTRNVCWQATRLPVLCDKLAQSSWILLSRMCFVGTDVLVLVEALHTLMNPISVAFSRKH